MKRYAANIITLCRIVFGVSMLFFPALSFGFYAMYLAGGITDMIDGTVARRTNSVSKFGSRLDTIADFVFTASALVKILPVMAVPKWALVWAAAIATIKITNAALGFTRGKRFFAVHTAMNKITGLLLFLLPLTFAFIEMRYSIIAVCSIATAAALHESCRIIKETES